MQTHLNPYEAKGAQTWYQQGHDILLHYWSRPQRFVSYFAKKSEKNKNKVIYNQWLTFDQWDLLYIKFNKSVNSLAISESNSRLQFKGIFGLSNIKFICRISDFKTQEVAEMSKIFHLKLLTEKILEFLNATKVITSYDHIIHKQEK